MFTEIYRTNAWLHPETVSGYGSSMEATAEIRAALPPLLRRLGTQRLLDAPCGDFHWMRQVPLPCDYVGADIVADMITKLQAGERRPGRDFMLLDITRGPFPPADAFFCRDCFVHLSFADVARVLENFRRSECRHLIASSYPSYRKNTDIETGEVRPLNLRLPPFNLPEPIEILPDPGERVVERHMGVWTREQVGSV